MTKYLTTTQYRDLDEGIGTDINDLALSRLIARAESAVDTCMKFRLGIGGFEPHNVWIQQKWSDQSRQTAFPSYPVPVQKVNRYRIQVSNLSDGNGFFLGINVSDAIINQRDGYIEIVPLEALTFSIGQVLLSLKVSIVQMDCFVSFYIPVFGEQLINTGNNQLYKAVRGFWASTNNQAAHLTPNQPLPIPPAVYVNGAATSPSNYTVDYTEGSVLFNVAQSGTARVTADYTATIPEPAREATIRQTSDILEQRSLRKSGMGGIYKARNADQEIQMKPPVRGDKPDVLCDSAMACLACYEEVAIA